MTASLLFLSGAKASVLAVCALAAVHVLPQTWIQARRRIALGGLWSLVVLPWISFSMAAVHPMLAKVTLAEIPASVRWSALVIALWAIGVLFRLGRLAMESVSLVRMAKAGAACGEGLLMVEGLSTPCMWGVVRPCILMPMETKHWPAAQWQAAVLHEQQHIRQHDGWHRMTAAMVRCVFWWNPLVHALCRRLEMETELCCDEAATATSSRRAYGEMLFNLAVGSSFETVPAWAPASGVKERIQRLLEPSRCGRISTWVRAVVMAGVVVAGLLAGCCIDMPKQLVEDAELSQEAAVRLAAEAFPLR